MKKCWIALVIVLLGWFAGTACFAQATASYDGLVQQGKTQLQSGNNDAALVSANAAIKANADRWEAYALAGGALMNLKSYEEAADQFGHAIDKAPEAKQTGLRDLRRQCLTFEAGTAPATAIGSAHSDTPPLQEILAWIQSNLLKFTMVRGFKDSNELTFQGCTVTLTDTLIVPDRPTSKYGKTSAQIDLTRLSPDSVTTATDPEGIAIIFNSDQEFTVHTTDWIKSWMQSCAVRLSRTSLL